MNLEKLTSRMSKELEEVIPAELSASDRKAILDVVRKGMQDASTRTTREMKETVVIGAGHEADLVHKIQEQMDKKTSVLVTNLMAMR